MKFLKYILSISLLVGAMLRVGACGVYTPDDPRDIRLFRCCSRDLMRQWQQGCRFQDYEKEQNCLLWQKITSADIPYADIEKAIYSSRLADLQKLKSGRLADNRFVEWLARPEHAEDLQYLLVAKEIEEIRKYMNDPWYYPYEGDQEHQRLAELIEQCKAYKGKRHAARYALQLGRLYFAAGDYKGCLDLWESKGEKFPHDIVSDMLASYAGGAYLRNGNREKAIELYTRSLDIGSLASIGAWDNAEEKSAYTDKRTKELEYIFNRFPNSPLLAIKLQNYVSYREREVFNYSRWDYGSDDEAYEETEEEKQDKVFYAELKRFAQSAAASGKSHQKGMWNYTLGYLHYLDGNYGKASSFLSRAEHAEATPFVKESIRAFRILLDAHSANNSNAYIQKLFKDLRWLDQRMEADNALDYSDKWQYDNKFNFPIYYWQDVARKALLGEACPRFKKSNPVLALQLANYANNRIYQISPLFEFYHTPEDGDYSQMNSEVMDFDKYRKSATDHNWFDYSSQFFSEIYNSTADDAARYARRIFNPKSDLDRFLNERSYVDSDYICDIVGTLYLREMNYRKAAEWLSMVSEDYQARTNIAKDGYFRLDPFKYQADDRHLIADSSDYKLRFAQEMLRLEGIFNSADAETNRKADAKLRYAIGLRNSFGQCWYLTNYGFNMVYIHSDDENEWGCYQSDNRRGYTDNPYAAEAYARVDRLTDQALASFTNPERAARAQMEMKNFATLMRRFPNTRAAASVRAHCDTYRDYALHRR